MEFEIEEIKTTELIKAIKAESITLVDELIKKNKEIISNCDVFQFTPLHWAAKKGFYLAIPKLISYGAQVNAQNFLGETPLHISVKRNNYECTVLLLIFLASPFIKDNKGRNPFEYSDDYQMKILYEKITKLYYNNAFTKNSLFYEKIQSQFIWFIKNEFSNQIKKEALIIVDGIEREMKIGIELEMKMKSIEKKYIPI
jgi:ankyrin repeat protein